ncbi:MAG: helix-turn-helix domain-containing protein [Burkholderiales bacterium]|nr:helix-turn-helix domain-containing protein [Burkholderiales bacterium]
MECLRRYLNSKSTDEQRGFAERCGTTIGYLRTAINAKKELGAELSVNIERESNGEVTRKALHPSNYLKKWPELAKKNDEAA